MAEIPTLTRTGEDGASITLYRYPDGTVGVFLDTNANGAIVLEHDDLAPIAQFIIGHHSIDGTQEVPC
jgi:hypothetical protein